jgi:hypothetical protein
MKNAIILRKEPGTHKPLVGSSNLPATTNTRKPSPSKQGSTGNTHASLQARNDQGIRLINKLISDRLQQLRV